MSPRRPHVSIGPNRRVRVGRKPPGVQGVTSNFGEIVMHDGRRLEVELGAPTSATWSRTIEAGSTISVQVRDPHYKLLQASLLKATFDIKVDGLWFRLVKVTTPTMDSSVTLTFEERTVVILKTSGIGEPKKAKRSEMTRAEFIYSMVQEIKPELDFYCPELHEIQPIAKGGERTDTEPASGSDTRDADTINVGFARGARLTVKGQPATAENKAMATLCMEACDRYNAPYGARVGLITCAINESGMTDYSGGDRSSTSLLQVLQSEKPGIDTPEEQIKMFLLDGATGYKGVGTGAIELANSGEPVTTWLGNMWWGNGYPNYPGLIYLDEARRWVDAWTGSGGSFTEATTTTTTKAYTFERRENESTWAAAQRLAAEVNWRFFVVSGRVIYISEEDLYAQMVRLAVEIDDLHEEGSGIDGVGFDWDLGKPVTQATINARAKTWAAPPGTVVTLEGFGPASLGTGNAPTEPGVESVGSNMNAVTGEGTGRYIVTQISGSFFTTAVAVTIKKPMRELPEPAAQTTTTTNRPEGADPSLTATSGGAQRMIEWAKKVVGTAEGSARHARWAAYPGGVYDPWCSTFVAYGLGKICGLPLPGNPAHSSSWMDWSAGKNVTTASIEPGDLVIYDWGDGGETDHVALYIGGGQRIGGNEGDAVRQGPAELSAAVGVVRPAYK